MTIPIQWTLGAGQPEIGPDVDLLVLVLSRSEVEACAVGRVVDDLMRLSEDARLRRQLAHGVVLTCSGYDADPREVWQVPEVRRFLQALCGQWNQFAHFLAPMPDAWGVLLLSLVDAQPEGQAGNRQFGSVDADQVAKLLADLERAAGVLHRDMGLGAAESAEIIGRSMTAIQGCFA
jgi:hypothetical protein